LPGPIEFQWDGGNINKNLIKHGISNEEIEETFFDDDKKILKDGLHSIGEERHVLIGKTNTEKLLFVVFTIRGRKIRAISARNLSKKEVFFYEKAN